MKNMILTSKQSGDARDTLGLSLRKAAELAGVPRNMLGLFERQRAIPADSFLKKLRDFYVSQGIELDSPEAAPAPAKTVPAALPEPAAEVTQPVPLAPVTTPDFYFRDGFVIPAGFDRDEVEAVLEQLSVLDEEIQSVKAEPVERGFFGGFLEEDDEAQQRLHLLMSRAYNLICKLQGRDCIDPCTKEEFKDKDWVETKGDRASLWYGDELGFSDEEGNQGELGADEKPKRRTMLG